MYISCQLELKKLLDRLKKVEIIALDTEFTRRTTYYPVLSLIQIAFKDEFGEKNYFIIDCLSGLDLSDFFKIINDEKVIKILHSAMQDLQIFYHESKLLPKSVFDTQIMGNLCGYGFNLGYSKIVEKFFDVKLDKKQQESDWQRRPLSKKQIEYARLDVVYLEEIYDVFAEKIKAKNRSNWVGEEMKIFIDKILFKKDDALFKNFSFRGKNQDEIVKIRNLILWREKWAQKINIPRKHFLSDEDIENMALNEKCDLNLDKEMIEEVKIILKSKSKEVIVKEKSFFMDQEQKKLYQDIKDFIGQIAKEEKLQEQVLISGFDIKTIVCRKNLFDKLVFGWRSELFGENLKEMINL